MNEFKKVMLTFLPLITGDGTGVVNAEVIEAVNKEQIIIPTRIHIIANKRAGHPRGDLSP